MAEAALSGDHPVEVIWEPRSKPQAALIACPVFEVFFGGSRGSLKTDSVLADWINHASLHGSDAFGLMVRRTREDLASTFERARQLYVPLGFQFAGHTCTSPNGAKLIFAYLDNDADADRYQGWNLTRVYVEEIGQFPNETPVLKLMATLRSTQGVPVGFRATGNPGGAGHLWVKARYIDPNRKGWEVQRYQYENPFSGKLVERDRVFIPGKITDHNLLGDEYVAQLQMQGSESLVRAWLLGDWDVIEGAFFDEWSEDRHVVEPFEVPGTWLRFRSMDWGFAKPFSVGWWAVPDNAFELPDGKLIPRGAMVRYREWYGCLKDQPNTGLRLTAREVAKGIAEREAGEKIAYGVLDPAAFAQDGGPSHAEEMLAEGVVFRRADNRRVSQRGAMGGWNQFRQRLRGEDGRPMMYVFDTCRGFTRTVPVLQHDDKKPEDLDTEGEDHIADEARYGCMSRPWVPLVASRPKPKHALEGLPDGTIVSTMTVNELIKRSKKLREEA